MDFIYSAMSIRLLVVWIVGAKEDAPMGKRARQRDWRGSKHNRCKETADDYSLFIKLFIFQFNKPLTH